MRKLLAIWACPVEGMAWSEFLLRVTWISVQLIAAYCLADKVSPFFYQRF